MATLHEAPWHINPPIRLYSNIWYIQAFTPDVDWIVRDWTVRVGADLSAGVYEFEMDLFVADGNHEPSGSSLWHIADSTLIEGQEQDETYPAPGGAITLDGGTEYVWEYKNPTGTVSFNEVNLRHTPPLYADDILGEYKSSDDGGVTWDYFASGDDYIACVILGNPSVLNIAVADQITHQDYQNDVEDPQPSSDSGHGGKRIACLGDSSSHSGAIVTTAADGTAHAGSIDIAVNGADHACPIIGHGVTPITAITTKTYHNGKLVLTKDAVAGCGAKIRPVDRGVYVE